MRYSEAVVAAVLATLIRATVDADVPVVLRTRRASQARDLACWLERVHGGTRTVVPSVTQRGDIEVRLPLQMAWPAVEYRAGDGHPPLATPPPVAHLSAMTSPSPSARSQ